MGLKCGIVGLPNVGKSTLFNTLTCSKKASASNYPFCTIEPNIGVVTVPDSRLEKISEIIRPEKTISAFMEFVDIAGLVKGANQGEGLGNQFLSHIRETQALLHIVRCFEDSQITHIYDTIDPLRDIEVITTELLLADLESLERQLAKKIKIAQATKDKDLQKEVSILETLLKHLNKGKSPKILEFHSKEKEFLKKLNLLSLKPVVYVCNTSETHSSKFVKQVKEFSQKEKSSCLTVSTLFESELNQIPEQEAQEFLESMGLKEPSLHRLIRHSYKLLGLNTFFTAGKKEVRAWTFKKGMKAPQVAGLIHSDFERGFIKAEVYHSDDLFKLKSEAKIRATGKYFVQGKDYEVKDGDVIFFKFNV